MHPIERLRMVARAAGEGPALLAQEAAGALAAFADDPAGLVTACRRLVDRQPTSGPLWWLSARVLAAGDPMTEAWAAAEELEDDPTSAVLAAELPDDATVCVVGWPEQAAAALARRGDTLVLVGDGGGDGRGLVRRLLSSGTEAELVPDAGLGAAAAAASLVLLEATALGDDGLVAATGSRAAAAVGRAGGVPVWAVAGAGRVLPVALWRALEQRLRSDAPWEEAEELVPLDLVDVVIGPEGISTPEVARRRPSCPVTLELIKEIG
ncbi:MAG: hypothetical protein ACYDAD_15485 [Acidimicrobiales bacterium]